MNKEIEPFDYDEDEAIKFIKNTLPQELKEKFSNDEIIYIVDIIYDFYESKGLMNADISDEDDVEIDEDEMIEYVLKKHQERSGRSIYYRRNNFHYQRRA